MKINSKKIISFILVCATLCSILSSVSFSVSAAVTSPNKTISAVPVVDGITIDGDIEDAWDNVYVNKLAVDAFQDSKGDAETRKDSSSVKFRCMYDEKRVYFLFEIYDDVWMDNISTTHWQNDSLFFVITEDSEKGSNGSWGSTAYMACVYPDLNKQGSDLFFARKGSISSNRSAAVKQVDANNRIIEFSFEFNTKTPTANDFFYIDFQYNDADQKEPLSGTDQNRTIVWNWSTNNASGNSAGNAKSNWGKINFCNTITPNKQAPVVSAHSVKVDGVIDKEWESVSTNMLETDAFMDSKGNPETRKNSSSVKFRVMYEGKRVYMLFELYDKDGDWVFGAADNYKNDSIFICVSEIDNPMIVDRNGLRLVKISDAQYSKSIYTLCAFPDTDAEKETNDLFFVRKSRGTNDTEKEIAVTEVDAENRIVELSFELNTITPADGNHIYLDIQYNDADTAAIAEEGSNITTGSPRTIVWNWSTEDTTLGFSSANLGSQWGKLEFVGDTVLTHNENKKDGASFYYQESLAGDSYRIVGLIDEIAISNIAGIKITFSDGATDKSITITEATAYKYIDATFDGVTVTYVADEGAVIVGWIVTGVAEGFVPSAVTVLNS